MIGPSTAEGPGRRVDNKGTELSPDLHPCMCSIQGPLHQDRQYRTVCHAPRGNQHSTAEPNRSATAIYMRRDGRMQTVRAHKEKGQLTRSHPTASIVPRSCNLCHHRHYFDVMALYCEAFRLH
nr:hypothetical protein CFP56_02887 [Quercus suber]